MHIVSSRRWLILPIETVARELYGKMLLACFAAERGWGVVLGSKPATRSIQSQLPRGTFLEKSISPGRFRDIQAAQKEGNRVSALCEEGILYLSAEEYKQRRLEQHSFDALDFFFTWGEQQTADILSTITATRKKLVVTGNPRFDLLRPEWRNIYAPAAEKIKGRFGRIILINSNFLFVNNGNPAASDYIQYLKSIGKIQDEEREHLWRREIQLQKEAFASFLKLLPILSEQFPEHSIIIRPHPSEDNLTWERATKELPNVHVLFEGSANAWILAADVTIQNNCTTGIEAFLLEKPSISYRPYRDEHVEYPLTSGVGFQLSTESDLVELTRQIIRGDVDMKDERQDQISFAKRYLANIDGTFACDAILDALDSLMLPESEGHFQFRQASSIYRFIQKAREFIALSNPTNAYSHKKFPGLTLTEVSEVMGNFLRVSGRFSDVTVIQISEGGFCIYKP